MTATLLAFALAQALDVASTCAALRTGREANPFLPSSCGRIAVVKSGVTVGASVALWSMRKEHPKLATWLAISATAVTGAAAVHNARAARRPSR